MLIAKGGQTMTVKIDYHAIRNLGYAMMADVWAVLGEHLTYLLVKDSSLTSLFTYVSWTFQLLQIVCHLEILASLFRLKGLNADYDKARQWYAMTVVTTALSMAFLGLLSLRSNTVSLVPLILTLSIYFIKILVQAAGGRAALRGTACLLDSFALEVRAAKNRRKGILLIISSAFLSVIVGALGLIIYLIYVGSTDATGVFSPDDVPKVEILWLAILLLSTFAAVICWAVSRFLAAYAICRSYKEIKELTR